LALAVSAGCSGSSGPAAPPPPSAVRLVQNPWDASRLDAAICRILLTEQLGLTVQVTEVDEYAQWAPIASGQQDASLEVWPSGHAGDIHNYIDRGQVENGGPLGPVGKISWYVPTYLLTQNPKLADYRAYADPAVAQVFATPQTGSSGRFLSGDRTWTSYDADIIANLGLDLVVVYAGSEEAELAELDAVYKRRGYILLYLWTPHAALAKYDLTPVQLPPYTPDCYAKASQHGVACDYPPDNLFKIFSPRLRDDSPRAYALLRSFAYATKDQVQLLGLVDRNMTIDQAARVWVDANAARWQLWVPP
jgi:glycine betaine/proline transport system substrate-binding protein